MNYTKNACDVYFYITRVLFLYMGKIIKSFISSAGVFLLATTLNLQTPKINTTGNSFAQNQISQKPKTEQVRQDVSSLTKEKYLKNLSVMMKQGWKKAQTDFKSYSNLKTPGRFKATFIQNAKNDDFESLLYPLNDSVSVLIKVLNSNSVCIEVDSLTTETQIEQTQPLSKNQVNEIMAFAYLELLSQKSGLEGMGLFGSSDVSLLYSKLHNKSETMCQCFSKGEPIVAFFSFIFEKQNMDFLKTYIEQDFDTMQKVLDSYLGQNSRIRLLSYAGKYSSLFEAFIKEVAQNGLLIQLVETMQNKFHSDPSELSLNWDEQNQRFVILKDIYEMLESHQKDQDTK